MRLSPAFALLLATTLTAQTPARRPMTFADLQAMHRISDPQISPSGKWVMFSVTDVDLAKNKKTNHLWAVPLAGGKEQQIGTVAGGESNGRFSPDGKSVMYTAQPDGKSQLYVAPWAEDTGTLGAGHPVTTLETEADGGLWAPDSKHFLFVSSVYPECESKAPLGPQHNQEEADCNAQKDAAADKSPVKAQIFDNLLYRHWNAYLGPRRSHIFYAGTDGGAPTDLTPASVVADHVAPTFSLGGSLGYAISPDGKEIAYVVNTSLVPAESTNNDIFILQVGASPMTAKQVSTSPGSDDGPQYSPDGKLLAWRSQRRGGFESDKYRLTFLDRLSGTIIDGSFDADLSVDEFRFVNRVSVIFTAAHRGEEEIYGFDLRDKGTFPVAAKSEFGEIAIAPRTDADTNPTIVSTRMSVDSPAELARISYGSSSEKGYDINVHATHVDQLTRSNDALVAGLDLSKMESFTFNGANGTEVQGFLIRPPNFDPSKKYPLKFLIHGGPQGNWGDAWSYRWNPELFAANGYVVVMINPRGSTGYGQKFVDEVSGDWGGRPYIDLMKGLDFAEAKYPFIDKTRECALGASYGGFMANWILTHTNRFACIVSHDGMFNPQSAFGTTEELWFNEWEFRPLNGTGPDATVEEAKPAHPWDFYNLPADQDPFRKFSPMLAIDNAKTPTLVIHSQLDYRLDVSEGLQLFTALQLRNIPSKMLYFPDEGHWVLKPQNSQLWYQTVNDWVDRWTHTNAYATAK